MNQPPENTSNNLSNNTSNNLTNKPVENEASKKETKPTNKKKPSYKKPKMHDPDFSLQSIIHSVSGIGVGSANDFSFAQIGSENQEHSPIKNIAPTDLSNIPLDESIVDTSIVNRSIHTKEEEKTDNTSNPTVSKKAISKKRIQEIVRSKATKQGTTPTSRTKRSKKINKAKLQKVFKTESFKHTHSTTKVMGGLIKLVKNVDRSINAKELVSELLIKWIIKENPALESKILQLFDQYLEAE